MDWLKLIRLVCAILVVFSHAYSVSSGNVNDEPLVVSTGHSLGSYAVLVFFIISGTVITVSLQRSHDLIGFFVRRVLRIWPALLASIFLTAFLVGPLLSSHSLVAYFTDLQLFSYLVGASSLMATSQTLPGLFTALPDAGAVNVPLWTLKYEVLAYVCAAILFAWAGLSARGTMMLCIALLMLGSLLRLESLAVDPRLLHAATFLGAFFAGSALLQARLGNRQLFVTMVFLLGLLPFAFGTVLWMATLTCAIACMVLWVFQLQKASAKSARLEFGDYSYGIYIFAFPLQQCVAQLFPVLSAETSFLLTMILVFPLAVLSWHLLEKRAIALGKRILFARPELESRTA